MPKRQPWYAYAATSAAVLIPCFWHSRLQAGDLASHLYNAWLADLIQQGKAPGLAVIPQTTNILFDLMLSALLPFGLQAAQRIPVALAVLVLVWGAFAFIRATSGRAAFETIPAIAMLAYGWSFHMGLFNFYISLGLCFWALALAWHWQPPRSWIAVPLLGLAYIGHGLPVAWAVAVLAYRHLSLRLYPKKSGGLLKLALAVLVAVAIALRIAFRTGWFGDQLESALAVDQVVVYGTKYLLPALGLLIYWVGRGRPLFRSEGADGTVFQVCLLTSLGMLIIPNWILIPGYHHPLVYLAQRMSLALGICVCAWTAAAPLPRVSKFALALGALLFFGFLYVDEAALNGLETRMEVAIAQLPKGQRVVNGIDTSGLRSNPVVHMLDRVCTGRCYSYGNYEPSSAQFRVRAAAPNPFVVISDDDANDLQAGTYVVKPGDLPVYQVTLDPSSGTVMVRPLAAGQRSGIVLWKGL